MRKPVTGLDSLTPTETEVLAQMASGMSVSEIAEARHIALNTAKNHVRNITRKLGVHSQLKAVVIWYQRDRHETLTDEERNKIMWYFDAHADEPDAGHKSAGVGTIEAIMNDHLRKARN